MTTVRAKFGSRRIDLATRNLPARDMIGSLHGDCEVCLPILTCRGKFGESGAPGILRTTGAVDALHAAIPGEPIQSRTGQSDESGKARKAWKGALLTPAS